MCYVTTLDRHGNEYIRGNLCVTNAAGKMSDWD